MLLLLPSMAFANIVPEGSKVELMDDFSGGLDTLHPSHKVSKGYSPYMRNVFVDNGKIEGINGFTQVGSTNTLLKITGIFPYYLENGTKYFIVTDSSVTLETQDFNSYTFISSVSNTSALLTCLQVRNKMWCYNGVDSVFTWDHSVKVTLNGDNNTPNVPRFKYGSYYQDRVFGLTVPGAASDLYFTSVVSTDGAILSPDDNRAWPSINLVHVGQGDGQIGTALWISDGQLRIGKEKSIYTLYGDNESNFNPRKEESGNGVISNDAVVVMDGASYIMDELGIYKNTERISDLISPDFEHVNKGVVKTVQNSWETKADFDKGQHFGSTATSLGILQPITSRKIYTGTDIYGPQQGAIFTLDAANPTTGFMRIGFTGADLAPGNDWSLGDISFLERFGMNCVSDDSENAETLTVTIKNLYTSETLVRDLPHSVFKNINAAYWTDPNTALPQNPLFEYFQVATGSFGIKIDLKNTTNTVTCQSVGSSWDWYFKPATTVQYLSEVSTFSSPISAWGNFDSIQNTNGGGISFYIHSATSSVNITTQTWLQVTPGQILNLPIINKYVQWATTIASVSSFTQLVSNIDNVEINHIEGVGSLTRAFAINWKNRYWLAVTTNSDSSMTMIYVKSKITNSNPNAWMPIEGYNFRSFSKDGDTFYGGSASTGIVYRLDYGTNFDGAKIQYIYDTPDNILGDYYFDKNIYKYVVDGDKSSGASMILGSSRNQGAYDYINYSIDGSGRYSQVIEGVRSKVKTLRLRLSLYDLDKTFNINSFGIIYDGTQVLTDK